MGRLRMHIGSWLIRMGVLIAPDRYCDALYDAILRAIHEGEKRDGR